MAHSGTTKLLAYMLLCLLLTISAWDSVCHAEETKPVEVKLLFIVEKSARIALSDEPHGIQNRIGIAREKLNTLLRNSGLNQSVCFSYCEEVPEFDFSAHTDLSKECEDQPLQIIRRVLYNYMASAEAQAKRDELRADLVIILVDRHPGKGSETAGLALNPYHFYFNEIPRKSDKNLNELRRRQSSLESSAHACCLGVDMLKSDIYHVVSHEVGHLLGAGHARTETEGGRGPQSCMEAAAIDEGGDARGTHTVMSYPRNCFPQNRFSTPGAATTEKHLYNNAETVKNFAHVVSTYCLDGGENASNSSPRHALRLPTPSSLKSVYEAYGIEPGLMQQYAPELLPAQEEGESYNNTLITWIIGSNTAIKELDNEPRVNGGSGKAAWYQYTAPTNGPCSVIVRKHNTTHGFTPIVAVYKSTENGLQEVEYEESEQQSSPNLLTQKKFHLNKGEQAYIAVDCADKPAKHFFLLVKQTKHNTLYQVLAYSSLGICLVTTILFFTTGNQKQQQSEPKDSAPARLPLTGNTRTYEHLIIKGQQGDNESPFEARIPIAQLSKEGGYLIGRHPNNDLRIPHMFVSPRHIKLTYEHDEHGSYVLITERGRTFGTCVNGTTLEPDETIRIGRSADVKLGNSHFIFRLE